jgi:hypothetical protein
VYLTLLTASKNRPAIALCDLTTYNESEINKAFIVLGIITKNLGKRSLLQKS